MNMDKSLKITDVITELERVKEIFGNLELADIPQKTVGKNNEVTFDYSSACGMTSNIYLREKKD